MDWLFKFQHPDRDTLEEKHAPPPQKKAAVLGFAAFFVTLQTAAPHSKDIMYFP